MQVQTLEICHKVGTVVLNDRSSEFDAFGEDMHSSVCWRHYGIFVLLHNKLLVKQCDS